VIWAIKDVSIISTFVDAGAAKFFLPSLNTEAAPVEGPLKRPKYALTGICFCLFASVTYFPKFFFTYS